MTFSDGLVGRSNAFGLLRLVLALLVIVSHAFPIGGFGKDPFGQWTNGQAELGDLAVVGFFAVSGYLITKSAQRSTTADFVWRRFLRIMPAFWFVLLVTAAVIGPINYVRLHGGLDAYLDGPDGPVQFVTSNALLMMRQFTIHDVFSDAPMAGGQPGVLNGSLWTLFFEVLCYLMVGLLAAVGLASGRWSWVVAALALLFYAGAALVPLVGVTSYTLTEILRLGSVFLTGATVAVFAARIPFDGRIATGCAAVLIATAAFGGLRSAGYVALTYLVLWAAGRAPRSLHRVGSVNDLSYGVYIFAWPVQMMLAIHGAATWGYGWYVLACTLAVVPCAALSWWLIEKPALALKDWTFWRRRRPAGTTIPSSNPVAGPQPPGA